MAYNIRFDSGTLTGLASSTPCVLLHATLQAILNQSYSGWQYATEVGGTFTFFSVFRGQSSALGFPRVLAKDTLSKTIASTSVLIDDGTGKWRRGAVLSDGAQATVNGSVISSTSRAVNISNVNGQAALAPSQFGAIKLIAAAADGSTWFSISGTQVFCSPITTFGALAAGPALVEIDGNWQVASL